MHFNELFEEEKYHKERRILTTPEKFSAFWMANEDGDKIIIHNNHHSLARQQSNIMHELAHIICEHEIPEDIAKLSLRFGLHYYNKKQEEEAACLGRTLQITREGLLWALRQNFSKQEIATYYNASLEMVTFRINATGVLRQVKGRW
jgi:Zn-dependent peptidase ImmA (M78 family)